MSDTDKIQIVKSFSQIVSENTKKTVLGNVGNDQKEKRVGAKLLEIVLGRKPMEEELNLI